MHGAWVPEGIWSFLLKASGALVSDQQGSDEVRYVLYRDRSSLLWEGHGRHSRCLGGEMEGGAQQGEGRGDGENQVGLD